MFSLLLLQLQHKRESKKFYLYRLTKNELWHNPHNPKINSKWITFKYKAIKFLGKKSENVHDLGLGKKFLDLTPKLNPWKEKLLN